VITVDQKTVKTDHQVKTDSHNAVLCIHFWTRYLGRKWQLL